jgi:putative hydrolase of the HAD superfamily
MVNSGNIKNIIFDFGGVILNIDFELSIKAFRFLGIQDFGMLYSRNMQSELFNKFEKGLLGADDFRGELRNITGVCMNDDEIDDAWNALILNLPPYRIKMLELIRNNYRIFLLSNSNVIHYEQYINQLKKEFGYRNFDELFKKAYFSHNMGMRKPDEEIFLKVLEEQNLEAKESLFIDDSLPNIETAANIGFKVHHLNLQKGEDMCWLFDSKGGLRFYD